MREKTTSCCCLCLPFNINNKLFTILYWRRPILVCRHPPAEGYNLLSFSSLYNPLSLILVDMFTNTQAPTYKRILPSLVLQLLLEGRCNPLSLVPVDMFTSTQAPTYRRIPTSFFLQGPCFINFQTGYSWYTTTQYVGHVS